MTVSKHGWPSVIAHADMDAFYAAIEQLDNPSLRGKPILVGPPGGRGVVLTASYEARPYKVGSAMPMVKARRLCPEATIVPPRFDRYTEVSRIIMQVFSDFSPNVEAISLDEAFIDLTGTSKLLGRPEMVGANLKQTVREATGGLTVSVGISATKYVAKVASAHQKPDGLTIVDPTNAPGWLAPLPVSRLWGVGPKTEERLHALDLFRIGDIAASDPTWLTSTLGSAGAHLYALAHAKDPRIVEGRKRSKSIGSERTLAVDVSDKEQIRAHLRRSAEAIATRLRRKGYVAQGVQVKLKTTKFQVLTRQHQRPHPTDVAADLFSDAKIILEKFDHPGPFRLVGMSAYELTTQETESQFDLFASNARQRRLETAIDTLTKRFGPNILRRADELGRPFITPNLDFLSDEDGSDDA